MQLTINGKQHNASSDADTPLLWVLRDEFRMTGTKFGCGIAQCGACTVLINGVPARACVTTLSTVAGADVTTVEGLDDAAAAAIQEAWTALDVPQCGYCQSGQIVAATALLRRNPAPTDDDIDTALSGNLCRCATYQRIRAAIHAAAASMEAKGNV